MFPLAVWRTFDDALSCVCVSFEWFGRWFECLFCMWVFHRRPIITQFGFLSEVVFKDGKVLVVLQRKTPVSQLIEARSRRTALSPVCLGVWS